MLWARWAVSVMGGLLGLAQGGWKDTGSVPFQPPKVFLTCPYGASLGTAAMMTFPSPLIQLPAGCITPFGFFLTHFLLFPPSDPAAILAAEGLKEFGGEGGGDEVFQMLITHCQLPPKSY